MPPQTLPAIPASTSWRRILRSNILLILVFLVAVVFPFIVSILTGDSPLGVLRGDRYLQRGQSVFWQSIIIEVFILSVLAMSYNLLFGFTGIISFGHALFFGMGGYIIGITLEKTSLGAGLGLIVGAAVGLIVCGLLGLLIGLVSLRLRGVYFAMFTLAVAETFFIYFGRLPLTNAEDGFSLQSLPAWIDPAQSRLSFYYVTLAFAVLTFLFVRRLMYSPTGAVLLAIRDNEERAQAIGYNTLRFKLMAITIASLLAGAAGMFYVLLNKKVGPDTLSVNFTVEPLLMTIIGGTGTFIGPVIGAAVLQLSTRFFGSPFTIAGTPIDLSGSWNLILGIAFILVVLVFPNGINGTLQRWWMNRQQKRDA